MADTPDPLLVDLLRRMRIEDPEIVAGVLTRAGFALPVEIKTHDELLAMPRDAVLRSGTGIGRHARHVTAEEFAEDGPWCLVDTAMLEELDHLEP